MGSGGQFGAGGRTPSGAAPGELSVIERHELIESAMPLARRLARRFASRSPSRDDVEQAALAGLVAAANRYDPNLGVPFTAFAIRTIVGELKRHCRDTTWAVRVPRRWQEIYLAVVGARSVLRGELGRDPTPAEIARRTGLNEEDVLEAGEIVHALSADSLDRSVDDEEPLSARIGSDDARLRSVEDRHLVTSALDRLSASDRAVVVRYFFDGASQATIARELGISQMQVSRILARTTARLRSLLASAA